MKPSIFEPALKGEQVILYLPDTGTSATGRGLGPAWASGLAAISHPVPTAGFTTEWRRTRFTSIALTANLELGVHLPNAGDVSAWRGNAASRGGFYFETLFMVNAIVNTSIRMFAGLSAQTSDGVCVSNTVPANSVGLWCDTTDAGNLTIVTADSGGSATKTALASAHTLTAGILYRFRILCNPGNQPTIVTQLENWGTDAVIGTQNVGATLPANTAFMAPQVGLSNAANTAGGDCTLDIASIYLRPNLRLTPLGRP